MPATDPPPPARAGRYELLDEIARGRMGVVYRATDTALGREVAVKFPQDRYGPGSAGARRFLDEARITGQLQHPGIPPVHEVGTLPDGRPFLAMKLIRGRTLHDLLNDRPDPAADRGRFLAAFEQVCQAVAYAHNHRVIHRDLKPANVMVGSFGEVQVMDWGLAKVLASVEASARRDPDPDSAATTDLDSFQHSEVHLPHSSDTQAGSVLGSPAYMPPEQAIGAVEQIDARSDVFALGGLLCAVLTGRPPYVGESAESTRQLAARGKLGDAFARLDGCGAEPGLIDLCRRCLAVEKADRPRDAGEVAAVVAALRSAAEARAREAELDRVRIETEARAQRKRRRVLLIAAAALLLILAAGVTGTSVGLVRASHARQRAEADRDRAAQARDRARQVLDDMTSSVAGESLATQPALTPEQKAFLAQVLTYYREFVGEGAADTTARLRTAQAARRVGLIEARLGHNEDAVATFRQARDGFASLVADFPDVADYRRGLAVTHNDLGNRLRVLGRLTDAEAEYRTSTAVHEAIAAAEPGELTHQVNAATARLNLGTAFAAQRRWADAEREFTAARAALAKLAADHPGRADVRRHLATAHDELGNLYKDTRKNPEAKREYEAGRDLRVKLVAESPGTADFRSMLAGSHNNLGLLFDDTDRPKEAEAEQREAVRIREKLVGDFPGVPDYRIELGGSYGNVGRVLRKHGHPADSLEWFGKGIDTLTPEVERQPQLVSARLFLRNTHAGRATALGQLNRHADAVKDWDRAVDLSPPEQKARSRAERSWAMVRAGRTAEALAEADELTRSDEWTANQLYDFACLYSLAIAKDEPNREKHATRAVELLRRSVAKGWSDAAHLETDSDLEPLRSRDDFKAVVANARKPRPK